MGSLALSNPVNVLCLRDLDSQAIADLLMRFGLRLVVVADGSVIPGSYWGDSEAGVIGEKVFARADTPVHSILHEAGHLIVLPAERRQWVHTNATDSDIEEDATCYLQIVLADALAGVGKARLMTDMDAWGYSFRLGSTRGWFEGDAADARDWLINQQVLTADGDVTALLASSSPAV
ncbi:MAG: hypothetical protein ACT4NL_16495 [Pseudomarimonas sp.]